MCGFTRRLSRTESFVVAVATNSLAGEGQPFSSHKDPLLPIDHLLGITLEMPVIPDAAGSRLRSDIQPVADD
jgi:hypothetical protein